MSSNSSSLEESLRSLSLDYLNLLINGQAFSDVSFSVEGRLVHAHKCVLAARSLFFRKFFCETPPAGDIGDGSGSRPTGVGSPRVDSNSNNNNNNNNNDDNNNNNKGTVIIPVNSVCYEVFLLMLQYLYSGQVSLVPQKHETRPNCGDRGCWHTHCTAAVDLALQTLAAATSFGVEQLALLTQKQLASIVEKASIEDVMKVLIASRKPDMHQLWTTCSHLVAKSGLPPEILAKHIPIDVVTKIEELRLKSSLPRRSLLPHHHDLTAAADLEDHKIRRMRRALDSSDVELVKLMVMGEGLNLDDALALHYAVENCSREVVKALLELGAADVNCPAGPGGKTPLHIAAEMVSPDMVSVLLDHHADPNLRMVDGVTPLDVLRTLTSDFLFKGAVPGLTHIEPNKLRLCLELVQSAALVISREEGNGPISSTAIYPPTPVSNEDHHHHHHHSSGSTTTCGNIGNLNLDTRMVYLNLGATHHMNEGENSQRDVMNRHGGCGPTFHHHPHHDY